MNATKMKVRRFVLAALLMCVLAAAWVLATDEGGTTGIISLILVVLSGALVVVAIMTAIRSLDELQRRINLDALALAFAGISLLAFIQIGFDEWGRSFTISPGNFLLILDALWMLGYFLAQRRYQ